MRHTLFKRLHMQPGTTFEKKEKEPLRMERRIPLAEIVSFILFIAVIVAIDGSIATLPRSAADPQSRRMLDSRFSEDNFRHQQHDGMECSPPYIDEDRLRGHQGKTLFLHNVCMEQVIRHSCMHEPCSASYTFLSTHGLFDK